MDLFFWGEKFFLQRDGRMCREGVFQGLRMGGGSHRRARLLLVGRGEAELHLCPSPPQQLPSDGSIS